MSIESTGGPGDEARVGGPSPEGEVFDLRELHEILHKTLGPDTPLNFNNVDLEVFPGLELLEFAIAKGVGPISPTLIAGANLSENEILVLDEQVIRSLEANSRDYLQELMALTSGHVRAKVAGKEPLPALQEFRGLLPRLVERIYLLVLLLRNQLK